MEPSLESNDQIFSWIFFLSGFIFAVLLGRAKGRLLEGVIMGFFFSWIGFLLVILLPENKTNLTQQYKPGPPKTKPPPVIDTAMGSISCGCAVLVTVGVFFGFMGLGMSSPSPDASSIFNVLVFGTMFAMPGAALVYTGLLQFGVRQTVATWCAGIYFAVVFGFTWILLAQIANSMHIYGR